MKRKFTPQDEHIANSAKSAKCGSTVNADSNNDNEFDTPYGSWYSKLAKALENMPLWFKIFVMTTFIGMIVFCVVWSKLHK